jgi:hypothetical protein
LTKKLTREEFDKDINKVQKLLDEAKELDRNLEIFKAQAKIKQAENALERLKAKYIPEQVTFT